MFTGIIEDIGVIRKIGRNKIAVSTKLAGIKPGDSVAVNGICLTVTGIKNGVFEAEISAETLAVTTFGKPTAGNCVNLERAMPADGRFGGHIVTGHVDSTAEIISIKKTAGLTEYIFKSVLPENKTGGENATTPVVNKGSVAIDGISLTSIKVSYADRKNCTVIFSAALIPFTLKNTTLGLKKTGDTVNLETDILAKYSQIADKQPYGKKESKITTELLRESGFLP